MGAYRLEVMGFGNFTVGLRKIAIVSAALAVVACGGPELPRSPSDKPTFVSLNPCLDAILVEVAEAEQVLALSHYSRDPAASSMDIERAAQFGVTGGTAEEVIALEPDIVLASSFIAPATKAALERAGMRVETFGGPTSVDESFEQVADIAALTDNADRGEALIKAIDKPAPDFTRQPTALLWQSGQIVAGGSSLVAEHLNWAGFRNHASERGMRQADHVALEEVLSNPPEILLIAGDAPGQEHPSLRYLSDMYVARFDPNLFYCAGPSIPLARARLLEIRRVKTGERP